VNIAVARTPAESALDLSLPHRHMEEWRWTDLRQLIDRPYPPGNEPAASELDVARLVRSSPFAAFAAHRLIFVNGRFHPSLSRMANGDIGSHVSVTDPVLRMNETFAADGARLRLEEKIDTPIELVFIATKGEARTIATRNVIEIAAGATATLIETHLGEGDYLHNSVTEIRLGEAARLDRVKVEHESPQAIHLSHVVSNLESSAVLRDFTLTSGARLNRQNGTCTMNGRQADVRISGSYLIGGRQHADTRLVVDHAVPQCTSRELFKCVIDGNARGIFQGKVIVRPGAQKTDGKQSSHGLLLSETAEFDAKPELEIFADDVICGHGATAGDLDHDHLFYLRSRGIPERDAKAMLIAAFVAEAFETIGSDAIRECLAGIAEGWMAARQ
jgi:Fe-S cluster assembly protein SufD